MFICLHHKKSGEVFYIPASHIIIIDQAKVLDKENPRAVPKSSTFVHTVITRGNQTLNFEVRESPEEVATLVNETLNTTARAAKLN